MLVNNETGAVQPVAAIVRAVRGASRSWGRKACSTPTPCRLWARSASPCRISGVDAASFSGHKMGGPRGVGFLYLRKGAAPGFLAIGGGQESGRRPGTENLPGICAMTFAASLRSGSSEENDERAHLIADGSSPDPRKSPGHGSFPVCAG